MSEMPNTMKLGMAAAFLGAICAFISMAMAWDGGVDSTALVGIDMAVAVVFFGVAGSFTPYSPVKGSTIVVLSAIATAASIIGGIYEALPIYFAILLAILGVVCIIIGNFSSTKDYVDANRVI